MLTLIGAGCFSAGLYYSVIEFEKQVSKWDSNYQIITDKVSTFEKVSDPKIIRKHINELNKILDDIDFLHTLIESGQITDEKFDEYLANHSVNVDEMSDRIVTIAIDTQTSIQQMKLDVKNTLSDIESKVGSQLVSSTTEISIEVNKLNSQFKEIQNQLDELNKVIDKIKNSKLSKYLK